MPEETYVLEALKRPSPVLNRQVTHSTIEEKLEHILIRHLMTLEIHISVSVFVAFRRRKVENINIENWDRITVGVGFETDLGEEDVEEGEGGRVRSAEDSSLERLNDST